MTITREGKSSGYLKAEPLLLPLPRSTPIRKRPSLSVLAGDIQSLNLSWLLNTVYTFCTQTDAYENRQALAGT